MSSWRFRAPGERARIFRTRQGVAVPRGMLALQKEAREERAANRRARRRTARGLEAEVLDALVRFRERIPPGAAEAAVASGDALLILNAGDPAAFERELAALIAERLEEGVESGAKLGLRFGPEVVSGVPVSLATEAAASFAATQAGDAVLGISETTRTGLREILARQVRDEIPPAIAARRVGELVGLDPRRATAVENFRRARFEQLAPRLGPGELREVEIALERIGEPLRVIDGRAFTRNVERVLDEEVAAFRDRQLLNRGRTIAENEVQAAITQGELAFWEEAARAGAVDPARVFKAWRTVQDARVCPICAPLHGQTIPFGDLFLTSVGARRGPPAHPRCRCFLEFGELDAQGSVPTRPDQGAGAIGRHAARRRLDPGTLQEDLGAARSRAARMAAHREAIPRDARASANLGRRIASNDATIASLEARLRDFGIE